MTFKKMQVSDMWLPYAGTEIIYAGDSNLDSVLQVWEPIQTDFLTAPVSLQRPDFSLWKIMKTIKNTVDYCKLHPHYLAIKLI